MREVDLSFSKLHCNKYIWNNAQSKKKYWVLDGLFYIFYFEVIGSTVK